LKIAICWAELGVSTQHRNRDDPPPLTRRLDKIAGDGGSRSPKRRRPRSGHGSEDVPPGQRIPPHRHVVADEIVFVHRGSGLATVGSLEKPVTEGATIYIPRDTRVTLRNTRNRPMTIVLVFSKPGFEEYLRDTSVREGEPATPMSAEEREERMAHSLRAGRRGN